MIHWQLIDNLAECKQDSLSLSFDQNDPGRGVKVRGPAFGTQPALNLFGTCLPGNTEAVTHAPIRLSSYGSSLRATFAETGDFAVESDVVWQLFETDTEIIGLDVVVSVATQRLDARPQLALCSRIEAAELLVPDSLPIQSNAKWNKLAVPATGAATTGAIPCVLCRLPGSQFSYAEMAHPHDFHSCEISRTSKTDSIVLRQQLFSGNLEKGVILRSRLRGVLLPRAEDTVAAGNCFARFLAADLPLGR